MIIQTEDGTKLQLDDGATPAQIDDVVTHYAQTAKAAAPQAQGFVGKLQQDYANRDQEIQRSVDATDAGKQSMPEMVAQNALSNASKLTDTVGEAVNAVPVVGPALSEAAGAIGGAVSKIPLPASTGYGNVGDLLASNTRLSRNLHAVGQAANLAGAASGLRSAGNAAVEAAPSVANKLTSGLRENPTIASRAAAGEVPTSTPAGPATGADIGQAVKENYDLSRHMNESFTPDKVADPFMQKIQQAMPKPATANGVLSEDQISLAKQLKETGDMVKGQPIDLNGIDTLDKALSTKIGQEVYPDGSTTPNGRTLIQIKNKLRSLVNDAPTDGTTALNNGRAAAQAQFALNDLDAAELKAKVKGGSADNYQTAYRSLFNDKDGSIMQGAPQSVKDLLEVAATPTLKDKLTGAVPLHGAALGAAALGHWPAAVAIEGGKLASDALKTKVMKARGTAVRQAIIDHAMGKIKDVNVLPPEYPQQLMLPAPGKGSALPMSDTQVGIAQRLMDRPLPTTNETPVAPPASQSMKIMETATPSRRAQLQNIGEQLRSGAISQNKFVKTSTTSFGLTPTQARSLAKEIVNYGVKK